MLWESNQARGWTEVEAAPANLLDWRERAASFSDIAFVNPFSQTLSLMTDGGPVPATDAQVSGNFFSVLGVPPLLGRTFREDETFTPGIALLSHEAWRRHFGADPQMVGRLIRLDGRPHEVIGVMGPEFRNPVGAAAIWTTPAALASRRESIWWRQAHVVKPIARLAPGASLLEAQLYQVNPRDPATLSVVASLIALVAVTAILWPTWRATRVDPVSVLRDP
jgi:putative ABC transport system permease protein